MLAIASTQQQKHKETNREKKGGERSLQENLKTIHRIVSWKFLLHTLFSKSFIFLSNTRAITYFVVSLLFAPIQTRCPSSSSLISVWKFSTWRGRFSNNRKIDPKNVRALMTLNIKNFSFSFHSSPVVTNRRRWTFRKVSSVRCHTHLDWDW